VKSNLVLRVDWVESTDIGAGRLGMTICPGRQDRDRDLEADLGELRDEGVDRLLCLSTEAEMDWAGVPELGSRAEAYGLNYRWLPVPDQGTCTLSEAVDLVGWCRDGLKRGESVVLTCMGGLGRSGMIAACTLVDAGLSPTAAIASVRAARGPRALETSGQEELVSRFAGR
jgi:protein-tyrosine phosphatase